MKIKVLTRNPEHYLRETKKDINKVFRNYDSYLHPFEAAREYTQALNAIKLERVFAKPFIGSLDGHGDGVYCLAKHPTSLSTLFSGACDGEIKIWNLPQRSEMHSIPAHNGFVRSICMPTAANYFVSVGDDKIIKLWDQNNMLNSKDLKPYKMIISEKILHGADHHSEKGIFATSGEEVDIWDVTRKEPIKTYVSSNDTSNCIKFNPIENDILATAASDRNITLYDIRIPTPIKRKICFSRLMTYNGYTLNKLAYVTCGKEKVVLKMRTNGLCWNPMEAYTLTCANEDYNLYTFDVRALTRPRTIHTDHVAAVLDVDYGPTGREFVSASHDKTIRIFPADQGRSREVYHAKRMQRVFTVKWSLDNKYIFSGSDEMNVRIWKAVAWEKLGMLKTRERNALNYNQKLKEKYNLHPEVSRISRHRHVPRPLYKAKNELIIIKQAKLKKESNVMKHQKNKQKISEKDKVVLSET